MKRILCPLLLAFSFDSLAEAQHLYVCTALCGNGRGRTHNTVQPITGISTSLAGAREKLATKCSGNNRTLFYGVSIDGDTRNVAYPLLLDTGALRGDCDDVQF